MFSDYVEFKTASKLLADRLNQLEDFEAETSMTQKNNVDSEFLPESEFFIFVVRTPLTAKSTKNILTLAFRFNEASFPETYFKACNLGDGRVMNFDDLTEFMPPILFKKVELEMPRFESTSNLIACQELQGYFKMNLCGLRDDYIQLTAHSFQDKTSESKLPKSVNAGFHKLASWVSWVLTFFDHGLPSKILTEASIS